MSSRFARISQTPDEVSIITVRDGETFHVRGNHEKVPESFEAPWPRNIRANPQFGEREVIFEDIFLS
jgi:hypothetical protein